MDHNVKENPVTGLKTIIAFFPEKADEGYDPLRVATSDHPHFTSIVRGLEAKDVSVYDLFDVQAGVNQKFAEVGSRYSIRGGILHRDLDPVNNSLTDQVARFIDEGVEDWKPLVRFMERVDANPNADSRDDLHKWIASGKLTVTEDGLCVGYKCVAVTPDGGHTSVANGPAVVDGQEVEGFVPQKPGSVVEMARSKVDANSRKECSVGLHVGTYKYAEWFSKQHGGWNNPSSRRAIMEVHFDPADAVAVPPDHGNSKVRVCRYKVIGLIDSPYEGPVRPIEDYYTPAQATAAQEYYDDVDAPDNW